MRGRAWLAVGSAALASLAILPWVVSTYLTTFMLILLVTTALAQSYDLVGGHLGYMNLGHAAFYGLGAYTFGILFKGGAPASLALLLGGCVPAVFALLISYPFFRLRGAYFALATFGLVTLMELLANNLEVLTGGPIGLSMPTGDRLIPAYYLSLLLVAGMAGGAIWLARSRFGLALRSIREDEEAAGAFGVRAYQVKCIALMVSAVAAGISGGIYGWYLTYFKPENVFGLEVALGPVVMAMVGGSGTTAGPLLGSVFVNILEEFLRIQVGAYVITSYGAILVLVGLFLPKGIASLPIWRRLFGTPLEP